MRVAGISLAYSSVQDVQKVIQVGWLLGFPLPPSSLQVGFCDSKSSASAAFALVCPALSPADTRLLPGLQWRHPAGPGRAPGFAGGVIQ